MGHYDCKYCDASPGEEHSADCERFQPMTNPKHTDTSRSGDLKPCPFCGGEAVDFYRANTGATADWCGPVDHWVCCTGECGASTCMHGTKDEAIAAWNTRTADRIEALEAEVERLREELAAAYIKLSGTDQHASDCATSNAPAMKPGPCDCKENAETFARSGDV